MHAKNVIFIVKQFFLFFGIYEIFRIWKSIATCRIFVLHLKLIKYDWLDNANNKKVDSDLIHLKFIQISKDSPFNDQVVRF